MLSAARLLAKLAIQIRGRVHRNQRMRHVELWERWKSRRTTLHLKRTRRDSRPSHKTHILRVEK
jgi:hypothetical protein